MIRHARGVGGKFHAGSDGESGVNCDEDSGSALAATADDGTASLAFWAASNSAFLAFASSMLRTDSATS